MTKTKEWYLKYRLMINCAILACLFFANCFWSHLMYIVYPILVIMILLDNLNNGFSYILFSLPFCFISKYLGLMFYLVCGIVLFIKCMVFAFKDKPMVSKQLIISVVAFFIYCFLPFGKYNENFVYKLIFLTLILFVVWVLVNQKGIINFRFNVRVLCIGMLISSLFSLTYLFSPYMQCNFVMIKLSDNMVRYQGLFGHANTWGIICGLCISFMAYSFMRERKWYDMLLLLVMAFAGIFSFSKTYLIILFIVLITIIVWLFIHDIKLALILSTIGLVSVGLFILVYPDIYSLFYDRFFSTLSSCHDLRDVMNMLTTYRFDLWIHYSSYLIQNPVRAIFGCGLGAKAIDKFSAHNAYISMVYQLGIVGAILFILVIAFILKDKLAKQEKKKNRAIWLPLVVIALIFLIEDIMFYII